jgi:hypothetical protein
MRRSCVLAGVVYSEKELHSTYCVDNAADAALTWLNGASTAASAAVVYVWLPA